MLWIPAFSADVVHFATPPLIVAVASRFAPSLKVTVPEGVPLYAGLIVAVNVTLVPRAEGLSEDWSTIVVFA